MAARGARPLEVASEGWRTGQVQDGHWNQGWQDKLWDWTLGEVGEGEAKQISGRSAQPQTKGKTVQAASSYQPSGVPLGTELCGCFGTRHTQSEFLP